MHYCLSVLGRELIDQPHEMSFHVRFLNTWDLLLPVAKSCVTIRPNASLTRMTFSTGTFIQQICRFSNTLCNGLSVWSAEVKEMSTTEGSRPTMP